MGLGVTTFTFTIEFDCIRVGRTGALRELVFFKLTLFEGYDKLAMLLEDEYGGVVKYLDGELVFMGLDDADDALK